MTVQEFFNEVFGQNVFVKSRTTHTSDKRLCAYTFMKKKMGMTYAEISRVTGRTHSSVIAGIRRFMNLLQIQDKSAVELWTLTNQMYQVFFSSDQDKLLEAEQPKNVKI